MLQDLQGLKERKVPKGQLALREIQDHKVHKDLLVTQVTRVHKVILVH